MRARKAPGAITIGLVFFILLMDVVGISLLYPVAPYIVGRYSDDALSLSLLTAVYAGAQFVAAPAMGKLGDRFGRRPVLVASLFGSSFGYFMFGIGGALWVLFLSRLVDGITAGNQSTAAAYIADISTPETQARNFALIGTAWGVGLVVGPALGAALGQVDLAAPAYTAAAIALIGALVCAVALPESLAPEQREARPMRAADLNPMVAIGEVARKPGLGGPLLVLWLFNLAFNGINSIETLFLIARFAAQPWQVGALLVLVGVAVVVAQRVVQPAVVRVGEQFVAVAGLAGQALGALLMILAASLWLIVPITLFKTLASAMVFPTLSALMAGRVMPREQGALMGVSAALGSLAAVLGPLWAGAAYDGISPAGPYWLGAAVFAAAMLLLLRVRPSARCRGVE
jgi:DHA1 family tetracycline resistance protein-like MFS transporter